MQLRRIAGLEEEQSARAGQLSYRVITAFVCGLLLLPAATLAQPTIYRTDSGKKDIKRTDLTITELLVVGIPGLDGLALDVAGGKMYWIDHETEKIQRADLAGTNVEDLVTTGLASPFGIALDTQSALPVELTSFTARLSHGAVALRWQTASETNNAGFQIERKTRRMEEWTPVAFVAGRGTTTEPRAYQHRIAHLAPGRHAFRLKQIDFDGAFAYSPVVEVRVALPAAYHLAPAYPNPFNPQTRLELSVQTAQHVTVAAYDVLGRRMAVLFEGAVAASQAQGLIFGVGSLAGGLYVIRAEGEHFTAQQTVTLLK